MNRRIPPLVWLLFFVSGACTLVYQVVWVRMLVLVFGTSIFAVSTVLTAFMAGLALGAFGFGRLADRRMDPLRLYAGLEVGIGLFALAFPAILSGLDALATLAYRAAPGAFPAVRFLLVFFVLLVPTTLMGTVAIGSSPVTGRRPIRRDATSSGARPSGRRSRICPGSTKS